MLTFDNMRDKQVEAVEFIENGYEALILADVGTGKTVISLTALFNLIQQEKIGRVLVLAPKRVAMDVWAQEVEQWEHLSQCYNMTLAVAAGHTPAQRKAMIDGDADIVIMTHGTLSWFIEHYPESPFDTLVIDEIDKFKDRTAKRFKGFKRILKHKYKKDEKIDILGIKHYRKQFETIIGLTGTPTGNHLLDLWAQVYVIDGGVRLGQSFEQFKRKYFYQNDWAGYDWQPFPGAEEQIYDAIADITFRIERDAQIPDLMILPPRRIQLPGKVLKLYKKFERDLILHLEDGNTVESPNSAAMVGKLREIVSGFNYVNDRQTKRVWYHWEKFNDLKALISEMQGRQLMIIYWFKEELAELQRQHPKLRYLGGGVTDRQAHETIAAWNSGELELLALHPASAGHGLNLQKSHANHIYLLTVPQSGGMLEQVIGRLRRTGNDCEQICVHVPLAENTRDEEEYGRTLGKVYTQQQLLDGMKKRSG